MLVWRQQEGLSRAARECRRQVFIEAGFEQGAESFADCWRKNVEWYQRHVTGVLVRLSAVRPLDFEGVAGEPGHCA